MANGDRFFGPNGASGQVLGTGASLPVVLDFQPQEVYVMNATTGATLSYCKGMADDSGFLVASGGGGSPIFTGSPLAPHSHSLSITEGETPTVVAGLSASLAAAPAVVIAVTVTAGGTTGPLIQVPNGVAPGAGQYSVNYGINLLSFNIADAIVSISVTYLKQVTSNITAGTPTGTISGGGGGGGSFIGTGGITPGNTGFNIGTNASINNLNDVIYWEAIR